MAYLHHIILVCAILAFVADVVGKEASADEAADETKRVQFRCPSGCGGDGDTRCQSMGKRCFSLVALIPTDPAFPTFGEFVRRCHCS